MFVDQVKISLKAGDGVMASLLTEKKNMYLLCGPAGGDGGKVLLWYLKWMKD